MHGNVAEAQRRRDAGEATNGNRKKKKGLWNWQERADGFADWS